MSNEAMVLNPVSGEVIEATPTTDEKATRRAEAAKKAASRVKSSDATRKEQVKEADRNNALMVRPSASLVHRTEMGRQWVAANWKEITSVAQLMYSLDVAGVAIDSAFAQQTTEERVIYVMLRKNAPITENKRNKDTGAYSAVTTIKKRYMLLSITSKFEIIPTYGFADEVGETKQACESWLALKGILETVSMDKLALHFRQPKPEQTVKVVG
jgi:hypothetical protein